MVEVQYGKMVLVIDSDDCIGCCFRKIEYCKHNLVDCSPWERNDGKYVIFQEHQPIFDVSYKITMPACMDVVDKILVPYIGHSVKSPVSYDIIGNVLEIEYEGSHDYFLNWQCWFLNRIEEVRNEQIS